jgi:hypothetical protein
MIENKKNSFTEGSKGCCYQIDIEKVDSLQVWLSPPQVNSLTRKDGPNNGEGKK